MDRLERFLHRTAAVAEVEAATVEREVDGAVEILDGALPRT
jgi:hypothetical protein